jgi:site-specific DNA-methyltransferase (adenine-specific)
MPEQLLGRIIKACSQPGEVVVDPFVGSATTLTVAKKLTRNYFGFELSTAYAEQGRQRLAAANVGSRLQGADEPKVSAPATDADGAPTDADRAPRGRARKKVKPEKPTPLFDDWLAEIDSPDSATGGD